MLVTGSSGFVAQSLIPKLEKLGFDVIGLDWKNGKHTKVIHDITKPLEIDDDIDTVIHLAARLEHERCSKEECFFFSKIRFNISSSISKFKNYCENYSNNYRIP